MLCFKRKKKNHGLMALAEGSMSFVRANTQILEKTEKTLEEEIERENRAPPTSAVGKVRRQGEKMLHSKQVLLAIVLFNVLDCILVLGELILDIYYLKGVLENSENLGRAFVIDMKTHYPVDLAYLKETEVEVLYRQILTAHIDWDNHSGTGTSTNHHGNYQKTKTTYVISSVTPTTIDLNVTSSTDSGHHIGKRGASGGKTISDDTSGHGGNSTNSTDHGEHHDEHHEHHHTIEEEIAHAFHKASITILAILTAETFFKIFCHGKHFFGNKLEVFDGVIVVGSFIVDLVFLKGLSGYKIQEFVIILAFLVPWRVIRVVNSLVVAVIDHEHFRMKLMYKQKKQIAGELKDMKNEKKNYERCLETLKKLAISAGVPEMKINQHLALLNQQIKPKKKHNSILNGHAKKEKLNSTKKEMLSTSGSRKSSTSSTSGLMFSGKDTVIQVPSPDSENDKKDKFDYNDNGGV